MDHIERKNCKSVTFIYDITYLLDLIDEVYSSLWKHKLFVLLDLLLLLPLLLLLLLLLFTEFAEKIIGLP